LPENLIVLAITFQAGAIKVEGGSCHLLLMLFDKRSD
jgi:hypothetical protein